MTVNGAPHAIASFLKDAFPPIAAGVLLLAVWEFAIWYFSLPNFVLPRPGDIVLAAANNPHQFLLDTGATLLEAVSGYVAGAVLGVALAVLFVALPFSERLVMPVYITFNSVPMIAYGPLAIIWFGIGSTSKIVLILISVSYIVLLNALAGLRNCDPGTVELLRTFGASKKEIFRKLRIPSALPWIFSGLRVAVVQAMILAVVLEMLGANSGLGWTIYRSTQMMDFIEAWVAVAGSVLASLVLYSIVTIVGRRVAWW
jgi:NitT/TauT family transport system permease protein